MSVSSFFRKIKICKEILDLFLCKLKKKFFKEKLDLFLIIKETIFGLKKKNQICCWTYHKKRLFERGFTLMR